MVPDVKAVRLLVASPSDVADNRDAIRQAMFAWSATNVERRRMVILPLMWEYDSVPSYGTDPQTALNKQLVDKCDGVIGTFWTRLGMPTGRSVSGTVEEMTGAHTDGKPVYLYFRTTPVAPDMLDIDEYSRLKEFKKEVRKSALYSEYADIAELQALLARTLDAVADHYGADLGDNASPSLVGAVPVASYGSEREVSGFSKSGAPRYRTRSWLTIENRGQVAAENLRIELETGPDVPLLHGNDKPVDRFAPGQVLRYPMLIFAGMADVVTVRMAWEEGGAPRSEQQSITLY